MKAWLAARAPRERQVLTIAALLAGLLLGWAWIWDPLQVALAQERQRVKASEAAWLRMQRVADEVRRLRAAAPAAAAPVAGSLLVRVDASLNASGIGGSMLRVDPLESGRVRVQFQAVDFDALVRWLEALAARDGVRVDEFGAQRVSAGRVDARVVLGEPGA